MCGIFCSVSRHRHIPPSEDVQRLLATRGPDTWNTVQVQPKEGLNESTSAFTTFTTLCSTVLSLRGAVTVGQPFRRPSSESTLCWNGEAWRIGGEQPNGNDTERIFDVLDDAVQQPVPVMDAHEELVYATTSISKAISQVAGPYAFVFHDALGCRLFFGRDFLGRRSLLRQITRDGDLVLSSVTDGVAEDVWSEVEANGVYGIDLSGRSYSRDTHEGNVQQWGDYFVANAPHTTKDLSTVENKSVGLGMMP